MHEMLFSALLQVINKLFGKTVAVSRFKFKEFVKTFAGETPSKRNF